MNSLQKKIRRLCEEKEAIVLAHYYTVGEVQEVADFVGDSLALARKAAETDAKIIVIWCCVPTSTPAARWPTRARRKT